MDVIACQRAGVAAVATMGTALTEEQMQALWRLHPEPTLCFDGDLAGRAAAFRVIDRALPLLKAPMSLKFALALGGKDPDEVLREAGAAALKTRLADTVAFVELLFVRERDAEPLDTPERRSGLKQRLRKAAAAIADPDLAGGLPRGAAATFRRALPGRAGARAGRLARRRPARLPRSRSAPHRRRPRGGSAPGARDRAAGRGACQLRARRSGRARAASGRAGAPPVSATRRWRIWLAKSSACGWKADHLDTGALATPSAHPRI